MPTWYTSPSVLSDDVYLVGVGFEPSLELARASALAELGSQISTTVISVTRMYDELLSEPRRGVPYSEFSQAVATASALTLRSVETYRQEEVCDQSVVALRISREEAQSQLAQQDQFLENVRLVLEGRIDDLRALVDSVDSRVLSIEHRHRMFESTIAAIDIEISQINAARAKEQRENSLKFQSLEDRLRSLTKDMDAARADPTTSSSVLSSLEAEVEEAIAFSRAFRRDSVGDLEGAARILDGTENGGALDARLARGDAIRSLRDTPDRIPRAAELYRAVYFDGTGLTPERTRASADYRLKMLRREIRDRYRGLAGAIVVFEGMPLPESIGWGLMMAGRLEEGFLVLLTEAETLDIIAQSRLKYVYLAGIEKGAPRHDPRALAFFQQTASEGNHHSIKFLSEVFANGWGITRNFLLAESLAQRASSAEAFVDIASAYLGVKNIASAKRVLREAADIGSAAASHELGVYAMEENDSDAAIGHFEDVLSRDPDNVAALTNIGIVLQLSEPGRGQDERAYLLFVRAARSEPGMPGFFAGSCLLFGRGVEANSSAGLGYIERSAGSGFPLAQEFWAEWRRTGVLPKPYWEKGFK